MHIHKHIYVSNLTFPKRLCKEVGKLILGINNRCFDVPDGIFRKRLCKEVDKLILGINNGCFDGPDGNLLSKKVTVDFYMLSPLVKHWIGGEVQNLLVIITYKFHRTDFTKMKFLK